MKEQSKRMRLHDTLSREVRELRASDGRTLRFYCCGPTVYAAAHIGNFRTFLLQDVFRRVLELSGQPTRHVRNITDVDDKTIRDSQANGVSLGEFTAKWIEKFHNDAAALNMLPPHVEPSAVGHIDKQIEFIEKLVAGGNAYEAPDGSVYYRVDSFPGYGKLVHLCRRGEDEENHKPGSTDADEYDKDNVADFALWKARKPEDGENYWDSPWGQGRPGWHIECSAMSIEHLGETFDLHGGGVDLVFPHHDNEIAQSEAVTGKPYADHWFHCAHLMVDGKKMSKSLGNLYTLEDLGKKGHTPMETRYVLVSGHYRQPLNFTLSSLKAARQSLERLGKTEAALREAAGENGPPSYEDLLAERADVLAGPFAPVWEALLDDLNTPKALGQVFSRLKEIEKKILKNQLEAGSARELWLGLHRALAAFGVLPPRVELEKKAEADVPDDIRAIAEERWRAKARKDFATADSLRDALKEKGWLVVDKPGEYELQPA